MAAMSPIEIQFRSWNRHLERIAREDRAINQSLRDLRKNFEHNGGDPRNGEPEAPGDLRPVIQQLFATLRIEHEHQTQLRRMLQEAIVLLLERPS
jgi:hypothetical protein